MELKENKFNRLRSSSPPAGGGREPSGVDLAAFTVLSLFKRTWTLFCAFACAVGLTSCSGGAMPASFQGLCESAGLCDEAPAAPELVDVLCDTGSCTREGVRATVDSAVRFLGVRPGSRLRLWAQGRTPGETRVVHELAVPTLTRRTRARRAQLDRFVTNTRTVLSLAIEPALAAPEACRSPIAESIAKVGLADGYGLPRRIVIISDAREHSRFADLACGRLPTDAQFIRALRRRGILGPGSLRAEVTFAFMTSTTVGPARCPVDIGRDTRIRDLWRAALTAAGAGEVRFDSGAPVLVGERPTRAPDSPRTATNP